MASLKVKIYTPEGTVAGEQELDARVFGVTPKPALIHEVVVAQLANARSSVAHTKTRGEVRGGGKKPWKQKHTGRARHGSTRSPLWVGGGVVFGPRNTRNWERKVNKKAKLAALKMVLSDKVAADRLVVMNALDLPGYKTKTAAGILRRLPCGARATLIALPTVPETTWKSFKNLPKVDVSRADSLNLVEVMKHAYLVTTVDGVNALTKLLS
jgi:large subunit ribosomal protein L4